MSLVTTLDWHLCLVGEDLAIEVGNWSCYWVTSDHAHFQIAKHLFYCQLAFQCVCMCRLGVLREGLLMAWKGEVKLMMSLSRDQACLGVLDSQFAFRISNSM